MHYSNSTIRRALSRLFICSATTAMLATAAQAD